MKIKYGSRVILVEPKYCCANVGDIGTIVDDGHYSDIVQSVRFLVRWDGQENLYGVHECDIKLADETA